MTLTQFHNISNGFASVKVLRLKKCARILAKMCENTGYKYNTIAGNYKNQYLSRQTLVDVINYLEGDFNIAMNLPYRK